MRVDCGAGSRNRSSSSSRGGGLSEAAGLQSAHLRSNSDKASITGRRNGQDRGLTNLILKALRAQTRGHGCFQMRGSSVEVCACVEFADAARDAVSSAQEACSVKAS